MGCVWSRGDLSEQHDNVFLVANVDEEGRQVGRKGYLEITASSLVLHEKGKDQLRWPLKSLRRFGAEQCIFSFESGRKCATGAGIYAFHCKRAPRLLQALHEQLRADSANRAVANNNANLDVDATNTGETLVLADDSPEALPRPPPRAAATLPAPAPAAQAEYANVDCTSGAMSVVEDGYLMPSGEYANLEGQTEATPPLQYATLAFGDETSATSPVATATTNAEEVPGEYCTIDINRTTALTTTAQQQTLRPHAAAAATDESIGGVQRLRGRLNSTLNELVNMKRHSNSVNET